MRTLPRLRANDKFSSDMVCGTIVGIRVFFLICGENVEQIKVISYPYKGETPKVEAETIEEASEADFRF